jgi:hypothetical protein
MAKELAYVIITPYSLYKSRTGGILTRLITRTGLELVGARMFAPSPHLVKEYSDQTISANDPHPGAALQLYPAEFLARRQNRTPAAGHGVAV